MFTTVIGQIAIPKWIRDALDLAPGTAADSVINRRRRVALQYGTGVNVANATQRLSDRLDAARGEAVSAELFLTASTAAALDRVLAHPARPGGRIPEGSAFPGSTGIREMPLPAWHPNPCCARLPHRFQCCRGRVTLIEAMYAGMRLTFRR